MHNKVRALRLSPLFGSKPVGYTAQPDFTNAAAIGETSMAPHELLATLQAIEARFGRVRSERYGPRTLDLDLLLFADQQLSTPELSLPHPEMTERGFVLAPLACLAPGWVHPGRGETIADLLRRWYEAGGGGVVQLAPA
jgi:2-amino-4-hydroxy-6-hydroxymethyldihydropteridine diphosphokinase